MPITYEIDAKQRLVTSYHTGIVTDEEIHAHRQKVRHDPEFNPRYRQLIDLSGITEGGKGEGGSGTSMNADSLIEILGWIRDAGIDVWLDGGWGVDALIENQSRPHKDVDFIVALPNAEPLTALLKDHGYRLKEGGRAENFVLADDAGREVDIHVVEFDAKGNGLYRMENGEVWVFPAEGFTGRGRVQGVEVCCLSPEVAVTCHASGYTPQEKDFADMELLERRFGVVLPSNLRRTKRKARGDSPG